MMFSNKEAKQVHNDNCVKDNSCSAEISRNLYLLAWFSGLFPGFEKLKGKKRKLSVFPCKQYNWLCEEEFVVFPARNFSLF